MSRTTRLLELPRRSVDRGRPYLAGAAAALALAAVIATGQFVLLLVLLGLGGAVYAMRRLEERNEARARAARTAPLRPTAEPGPAVDRDVAAVPSVPENGAPPSPRDGRGTYARTLERLVDEDGRMDFADTLAALAGLVGRRVQVMLAAGEDTWAVGEIHGLLRNAADASTDEEPGELMLFMLDDEQGEPAGAFVLPSLEFDAGVRLDEPANVGVGYRAGGAVVLIFDEGTPEDYRRRRRRGGEARR